MGKKVKKAKREAIENLLAKIDNEGLGYWLTDYFDEEELKKIDPTLVPIAIAAREAYLLLEIRIEELQEAIDEE